MRCCSVKVNTNFSEQQIRELIRDEIAKMEVRFYSIPSVDKNGNKVAILVGKLVSSEEPDKFTLEILNNNDTKGQ